MKIVVPKEGAAGGSELKLVGIVWTKIEPTCAVKYTKSGVIWCGTEKAM
jgi:hypothetical protein